MVDERFEVAEPKSGLSRRTVMKGAAWTVPALMVATAAPAQALSCVRGVYSTHGHGKLLGGSLLGINLDNVAELNGQHATAPTPNDPDEYFSALDLSVLGTLDVTLTGLSGFLSDFLTILAPAGVGVVNEYAYAESDGDSRGASGAVADNGTIALNDGDPSMPTFGTLDLRAIIQNLAGPEAAALVAAVANLQLEIGAIAGRAWFNPCKDPEVQRDYLLAHLRTIITSDLVGDLATTIEDAVLDINVLGISGLGVDLGVLVNGPLPSGTNQPIQADLTAGTITIDISTLLSDNADPFGAAYSPFLNGLPANSVLFVDTPLPSGAVTAFMGGLIAGLQDRLLDAVSVTILGNTGTLRELLEIPIVGDTLQLLIAAINALFTSTGPVKTLLDGISGLLSNLFYVLQNLLRITVNAQNPVFEQWSGILNPTSTPTHTAYSVAPLYLQAIGAANVLDLYLAAGGVGPITEL